MTATAQPPRTQVKLEAFTEPDRLLHSNWLGSHGTPHESGMILHYKQRHRRKCKSLFYLEGHKA